MDTDEATSALDATSRVLVFEALKRWRANKTTVVITHDLSQIAPDDFVYVLGDGCVVEQGYRKDLQAALGGVFRDMVRVQAGTGGCLPEKEVQVTPDVDVEEKEKRRMKRPVTWGNWLVETVPDLASIAAHIANTTTNTTNTDEYDSSSSSSDGGASSADQDDGGTASAAPCVYRKHTACRLAGVLVLLAVDDRLVIVP